jgi:hypothetical protein
LAKRFQRRRFLNIGQSKTRIIHILIFFLANLAKGNMSFCHHLVSVVCHPFNFHIIISSEYPQPNEEEDLLEINCCLWQPCLLTDQEKMSNLYRASFSSFGQAVSEEKIFHILIFSSKTSQTNELKLGRKHI